jgi:hypothetical protein
MTDLTWPPVAPDDMALERKPRRCLHPKWKRELRSSEIGTFTYCGSCQKMLDPAVARRGRNNRARGNAIEREIAAKLGLRRVGQYGGADDIRGLAFAGQVKSGTAYPEKFHRWLKAVPVNAGETAILVVTDAPGPGHQRRALVILDLSDWTALHGPLSKTGATE